MEIRRASTADFDLIKEIKLQAKINEMEYNKSLKPIEETKDKYLDYLKSDLSDEKTAVLIAMDENVVVGIVTGRIYSTLPIRLLPRKGHISNLYVLPDHRNKGVASGLIEELLAWFKDMEIKDVHLGVQSRNAPVYKIIERAGFREYAIEMKKTL